MNIVTDGQLLKLTNVKGVGKKSGKAYDFYKALVGIGDEVVQLSLTKDLDPKEVNKFAGKQCRLELVIRAAGFNSTDATVALAGVSAAK